MIQEWRHQALREVDFDGQFAGARLGKFPRSSESEWAEIRRF